jgi:hypothetical protein
MLHRARLADGARRVGRAMTIWSQAERDHAREAAKVISDLLCCALREGEQQNRHLYEWERRGIEWLRTQWKRDPETWINMWTGDLYVNNANLDMDAKLSVTAFRSGRREDFATGGRQ